ncbi:uncharacterized protein LOC106866149 [Brachypodium distachyon]|uniref:uncharacterized protein LOC106866149 n=1 Tax=Brachypodium distachyon TaxID=15368 RepID=UPI00071DE413|nr:uncharacterized protein LOC106866149 [Brachypodium distachyon]|eukprot:XP_014754389.1 uncharacterized protein LOC106866149 [Brachypodium distachyon]
MAALRRLGGSVLQRPAVPDQGLCQRGLFLQRRLYNTESKIQQKKEELYNMISKAEKRTFQNNRLIRHLSVQVKPRTGDPKWHLLRIKKWMTDVVVVSGVLHLASHLLVICDNLLDRQGRKLGV